MVNGLHGGNLVNAPRLVEEDRRSGKEPVITRRLPAAANIALGHLASPMSVMRKDVQVNIFFITQKLSTCWKLQDLNLQVHDLKFLF